MIKSFVEIALSRTEIQDGLQNWWENDFGEKAPDDSVDTLVGKNFAEISLSYTVSMINEFLHFKQKLKMAAKNGGKTIFGKVASSLFGYPGGKTFDQKSPYPTPFLRYLRFFIFISKKIVAFTR